LGQIVYDPFKNKIQFQKNEYHPTEWIQGYFEHDGKVIGTFNFPGVIYFSLMDSAF
jgi:hypothetical protein